MATVLFVLGGPSTLFDEVYSDIESSELPQSPSPANSYSLNYTPSRHVNSKSTYRPEFHPYQRDWSYHNRPAPNFPPTPGYSPGYSPTNFDGSQIEMLLQSQKSMMKTQEELVQLVKGVSERVEKLEKTTASASLGDEVKKLPPQLSVSYVFANLMENFTALTVLCRKLWL